MLTNGKNLWRMARRCSTAKADCVGLSWRLVLCKTVSLHLQNSPDSLLQLCDLHQVSITVGRMHACAITERPTELDIAEL